jgi:hypothetical protein
MKLDEVDPVAEAIMRPELGYMPVRLACEVLHFLAPNVGTRTPQRFVCPCRAKHLHGLD